jgi:hypothetical protein
MPLPVLQQLLLEVIGKYQAMRRPGRAVTDRGGIAAALASIDRGIPSE